MLLTSGRLVDGEWSMVPTVADRLKDKLDAAFGLMVMVQLIGSEDLDNQKGRLMARCEICGKASVMKCFRSGG